MNTARDLTIHLRDLLGRERVALAEFLLALSAFDPVEIPPMRAVVTCLRDPAPAALALSTPIATPQLDLAQSAVQPVEPAHAELARPEPRPAAAPPATVQALTAELSRYHLTVSRRFLEKLSAAQAAVSHSRPGARPEEILEAGLDFLLDRGAKRKGLVKKPRATVKPSSNPEYVPAHVRREVWKRDAGRCQFKLASGEICGSTYRVQIDHHPIPRALGGPSTVNNCRLACRVHNDAAARAVFGDAWMDRFTRGVRRRRGNASVVASPSP